MKKILLAPNPYRDRDFSAAARAAEILKEEGFSTVCCPSFVPDNITLPDHIPLGKLEDELDTADMIICFGGDGTILHMAKAAALRDKPILGVNLGGVGFMADLEARELPLLKRLRTGEYVTEKRMMLSAFVLRNGKCIHSELALNDAVLTKGAVARVLNFSVASDGVEMMRMRGDGIIVSAPTGSTAYAMSAGGPIVEPTARNILVTPICAHTISARAFVLNSKSRVTIRPIAVSNKAVYLSVDGGRAFRLSPADTVEIVEARQETTLIRIRNRSFYETVNLKLGVNRKDEET